MLDNLFSRLRRRLFAWVCRGQGERLFSQSLFLQSIHALQEGYVVQDRDGVILLCNLAAERLLGVSSESLTGKSVEHLGWRFLRENGDDYPRTQHPSRLALQTGQPQEAVIAGIQTPGAEIVWLSMKAAPVFHAGQAAPYAAVLTFTDITAKRQIEADLQTEREFQQALLESLQSGIVACDAEGILTLFNRAAREFHGLSEQPLPPDQWADRFDLYQSDGITPLPTEDIPLFRAFAGEVVRDAEMVIAPADAPSRTLLVSGQAIYGSQGQKLGAVVAMHDVTVRRQIEQELSRLAAIVASSEEAIMAATLDGILVSWNAGAERLYGYAASEMIGQHASVLLPEGVSIPVADIMPRLLRGEPTKPVEIMRRHRNGLMLNIALAFSPIHNANGEVIGLSCIARDITARRQAEDALRESETRLRYLAEAAFEGIAVSQDGVMVDANPAFLVHYGYETREEIFGLTAECFVAPQARTLIRQKIEAGAEDIYEALCQRRDGSTFPAEIRGRQILWNGRPARATAVRDVTERKAVEEALHVSHTAIRESEARLAEAQRIAKVGSWEYDLIQGKVIWSGEMFRLLGRDPDAGEPDFETAMSHYHPEDAALLKSLVARAAQEGNGYELDLRGNSRFFAGSLQKWYRTTGEAIRDEAGHVVRLMGTLTDITERRAIEDALQESQRFAQSIAENSASIIFVLDLETRSNVYSNRDVAEFLGYTPEQIMALGQDLLPAMIHPDDLPRLMVHLADFSNRKDGEIVEFEYRAKHASGEWRWIWNREVIFKRRADGTPWQILGNAQDVTTRRETEEALRRSEEALRALMSSAPIILYAADADGTITLSEGTGLAALGLAPGETVGRSVFEFSERDGPAQENTRRALAGETVSYDVQVGALCLHTEIRPRYDAGGNVTGIIGVCFDITERAQSEERFRVLFEQSSNAHLLFDDTGIIDCNPAALAMMRCADKAQLQGIHPAMLSPEYQPDGRLSSEKGAEMCALARKNGSHQFEWTRRAFDGTEFPVEVTVTVVILNDQPTLLSVWHNLTERKQAEQQINDYMVILEFQKSQLEETNRELEALATTDGLTGLKNHRTFQEKLAEEYSRALRYQQPLSLLLLDVDHFKQYNDNFGHPAGDAVLRQVAATLGQTARDTDIAARYGGEEFALILPLTDEAGAMTIAERVRAAIAGSLWKQRPITVSIGVCSVSLDTPTPGSLISFADQALYQAKEMGRNRVSYRNSARLLETL